LFCIALDGVGAQDKMFTLMKLSLVQFLEHANAWNLKCQLTIALVDLFMHQIRIEAWQLDFVDCSEH